MRALLAVLVLIGAPAAAAAKPLDLDRTFARGGVLRMNEPTASVGVIALSAGGTLHATHGAGIMRLSDRGRRLASTFLEPAGTPKALAPSGGGALVIGYGAVDYGKPTPLGVWRVDRDGRTLAHHVIALPGDQSANPEKLVKRGGRAFALVTATHPEHSRRRPLVVALTAEGALDADWGDGGFRTLGAGSAAGIGISPRDRSLVVAQVRETRCERLGYTERRERTRLRVIRFGAGGERRWARTMTVGGADRCPLADVGDVVDEGARIVIGGAFGRSAMLLALRGRDGTRNRRFGRGGAASFEVQAVWTPIRIVRRRGGYAFGYTDAEQDAPSATVGLMDRRGRRIRRRRLKTTQSYPSSALHDLALDRRGGLVAAGQLHDTDIYIREDYGQPHLAVWRVRTR